MPAGGPPGPWVERFYAHAYFPITYRSVTFGAPPSHDRSQDRPPRTLGPFDTYGEAVAAGQADELGAGMFVVEKRYERS